MSLDQAVSFPHPARTAARMGKQLPPGSVYRSTRARQEFFDAYDAIVERLPMPVRGIEVSTRFGRTHLALAGGNDERPLLLLPGMSICAPMMLEFFSYLTTGRTLIAPDLVGQPGLSADRPFSPRHNAYGEWLVDVLDGLGIDRIDILGPSFGGAIALDLAALQPERIGRLALITPAGVTPSIPILTGFAPLFVSWLSYRLFPYRPALAPMARVMCRDWSPENLDYLGLVIRATSYWRHRPAGPFAAGQFMDVLDPVFIAFSGKDRLLPFAPTRAHAHKVLPIAHEMIMEESAHMPSVDDIAPVRPELIKFFA